MEAEKNKNFKEIDVKELFYEKTRNWPGGSQVSYTDT
jgi:hypothetical protein